MIGTAEDVIEVAKFAEKHNLWGKIKDFFREEHTIILLGRTGAGKTQLAEALQNEVPEIIKAAARTKNIIPKETEISNFKVEIIDTPGDFETERKILRQEAIRSTVNKKNVGILSVVCNGYNEFIQDKAEVLRHAIVKLEDGEYAANEGYLAQQKDVEREFLDEWTNLLSGVGGAKWLITVITKIDLWGFPEDRQGVEEYYSTQSDENERENYCDRLGSAHDIPNSVVLTYSPVFKMWYDLVPGTGYYTDGQRRHDRIELIKNILLFMAK